MKRRKRQAGQRGPETESPQADQRTLGGHPPASGGIPAPRRPIDLRSDQGQTDLDFATVVPEILAVMAARSGDRMDAPRIAELIERLPSEVSHTLDQLAALGAIGRQERWRGDLFFLTSEPDSRLLPNR